MGYKTYVFVYMLYTFSANICLLEVNGGDTEGSMGCVRVWQ